jgi:hypothetical protein
MLLLRFDSLRVYVAIRVPPYYALCVLCGGVVWCGVGTPQRAPKERAPRVLLSGSVLYLRWLEVCEGSLHVHHHTGRMQHRANRNARCNYHV